MASAPITLDRALVLDWLQHRAEANGDYSCKYTEYVAERLEQAMLAQLTDPEVSRLAAASDAANY